ERFLSRSPMKHIVPFLMMATSLVALPAEACDSEVHGVKLSAICRECGVVSDTRVEVRKGESSGVGTVGGAVAGGVLGHQIGHGSGRTAMSILGAVGGGFAGNAIE